MIGDRIKRRRFHVSRKASPETAMVKTKTSITHRNKARKTRNTDTRLLSLVKTDARRELRIYHLWSAHTEAAFRSCVSKLKRVFEAVRRTRRTHCYETQEFLPNVRVFRKLSILNALLPFVRLCLEYSPNESWRPS